VFTPDRDFPAEEEQPRRRRRRHGNAGSGPKLDDGKRSRVPDAAAHAKL
jgi:hypothetical protein